MPRERNSEVIHTLPNTVDAILPLRMADYDRSEILRISLRRFFSDLGTCWIVAPDHEAAEIKSRIGDTHYVVVAESDIVPELKNCQPVNGWFVQQLLKMAIADHITTDFYLTLDADVICTRPVKSADLIKQGRALGLRYVGDSHRKWYDWASRVLNVRASRWMHSVTPTLVYTQAMLALQDYLAYRDGPGSVPRVGFFSRTNEDTAGNWRQYLLRSLPWTEYALYFTFLESMGMYEEFYFPGALNGNSVWKRDDFVCWQPARSFVGRCPPFFTVMQSNLGLDVTDVWKRVRGYLQEDGVDGRR
jgi:hypothetical protein